MGQKNYKRALNPEIEVMKNSLFLFGPRGIGKSFALPDRRTSVVRVDSAGNTLLPK
jgi:hypothetical protein